MYSASQQTNRTITRSRLFTKRGPGERGLSPLSTLLEGGDSWISSRGREEIREIGAGEKRERFVKRWQRKRRKSFVKQGREEEEEFRETGHDKGGRVCQQSREEEEEFRET